MDFTPEGDWEAHDLRSELEGEPDPELRRLVLPLLPFLQAVGQEVGPVLQDPHGFAELDTAKQFAAGRALAMLGAMLQGGAVQLFATEPVFCSAFRAHLSKVPDPEIRDRLAQTIEQGEALAGTWPPV